MDNGLNTKNPRNLDDSPYFTGGDGVDSIEKEGISSDPNNFNSAEFGQPLNPASSKDIGKNALFSSNEEIPNSSPDSIPGNTSEDPVNPFLPPDNREQAPSTNQQPQAIPEIPFDPLNPDILAHSEEPEAKTEVTPADQQPFNPAGEAEKLANDFDDPGKFFEEIQHLKDPEGKDD